MAGRARIAVTGIQDQWLTGEPQFSYFVTVYKRHTRFSTEAVEMPFTGDVSFGSSVDCRVPNNIGDLMRGVTLKVKLGNLSSDVFGTSINGLASGTFVSDTVQNYYNISLGKSIIKYADLIIGGQVIERLTGEYIYMYDQLHSNKDDVDQTLYFMNGHNKSSSVSPDGFGYNTFYINLPFYFYRNPGLAVPVCALTKQLVEVRVTFRDVDDDVTFKYTADSSGIVKREKTTEGSIINASLITDFYFITEDEKNFLLTRPMEYVITQLQKSSIQFKPGELKKSVMLNFENPVKELMFLAKEETGNNYSLTEFIPASFAQLGQDIDGESAGDKSGWSVAASSDGSRVAIGAREADEPGGTLSGHVRVYQYDGSTWNQLGSDIDGEAPFDLTGNYVTMSSDGSRVAIGSIGHDNYTGRVRVFEFSGPPGARTWNKIGQDMDGETAGDRFGKAVAMSSDGSRVAIGAYWYGSYQGRVEIYDYIGTSWTLVGSSILGEVANDQSGWSVAMSSDGSRVAIGARFNNGIPNNSGHVRVYRYDGSTWNQLGSDIDGENSEDQSGYSVAMSSDGSRVAIGAIRNDGVNGTISGHVRVYMYDGSTWNQLGSDIDGEDGGDESGWSVAMSSDGSRVAIGARYNDEIPTNSGHVRIYDYIGSTWTQVGSDIDAENSGDQSGQSVAMSSDGSRVFIGAPENDGNGVDSGHVRAFEITTEVNTNIHEDRLLNTSASDQSFDSYLQGNTVGSATNTKRSDHRALKNIKLECNGATVFDHSGQYLAYQQSLRYHTGCPDPAYEFYTYSFALKPEVYYPTGQLNMSRIIHKKLDIELDTIPTATSGTTTVTNTRNINVGVYAHSYNVLHIESGLAGLKF